LPPPAVLQPAATDDPVGFWQDLFRRHLDIWRDDLAFRANADLDDDERARHFDSLRRVYPDRLEYARFRVPAAAAGIHAATLRELGFDVA